MVSNANNFLFKQQMEALKNPQPQALQQPQIKSNNISFKNLIRNYSNNIVNIRDTLLASINIDINDWLNDNIT